MSLAAELTIVLAVDHGSVTGGQSRVAIESALGLAAAGARVVFFCAAGPVDDRLAQAGVETICLGQHDILSHPSRAGAAVQGLWNREAERRLAELIARLPRRNTIIHVHGWAKALSPAIARPIHASRLPAVYTMHEYFLHCPNGGFYNYVSQDLCALEPMSLACWGTNCDSRHYSFKLWRNARQLVATHAARLGACFNEIVLISNMQERLLAEHLPKNARLHRVCNPIDIEPLGLKSEPAGGDIIYVGRLSPEKGVELFARAAAQAGMAATFIGDGPLAESLRRDFPSARLLGWRSPEFVRVAMREARALVFPSLWRETQGMTAIEAKALGTPVIVSDVTAACEHVVDDESGLWFRSGDVGALAQALLRMKDDALTRRLSHEAYRSYWSRPATRARHVEETLRVYAAALARANDGERLCG